MTFLADLGLLALGSRARALSEQLYAIADAAYRARGATVQGRWFPVLRFLSDHGPQTVGAIAAAIGQTHSAVSQLADKLVREGWLRSVADKADRRCRRLALTPKARAAIRDARPVWRALVEELGERCRAANVDILGTLDAFERVLDPSLADAIAARATDVDRGAVRVVAFAPELAEHFYRLNADWLTRYFSLEDIDRRVLSNPVDELIAPGGAVLFATLGDAVVGTCALKYDSPGTYELTKMAVDERYQGLGIGRQLLDAAIDAFRDKGGDVLFLESNRKLAPALALYEAMGFEHQPTLKPDSHYARSDVYMIWRDPAVVAHKKRHKK